MPVRASTSATLVRWEAKFMTRVVAFALSLIAAGAASAQTEVESANYMLWVVEIS